MKRQFQINLRGMIDLLANHLYSSPEVFLRELMQNAVDAITARIRLQPDHPGEITLELSSTRGKSPTLTATDNGVGMTEDEIHRFLATIGESSKRDAEGHKIQDYLGQFGIGLLSCFVVCDEIVVVTKSARDATSPAVEWRGREDGTYSVRVLETEFSPGTRVYLTCRSGSEDLFAPDRIRELAAYYGSFLPYPITVSTSRSTSIINREGAPWRRPYRNEKQAREALLRYARTTFEANFLDAIPLQSRSGGLDGVAYVLPQPASLAARHAHRVYLKNMLLGESADNLLPDWAFFVKAVVNVEHLRPTASRESFVEDERLEATRVELGACLREYLVSLAQNDPQRMARFLDVHHLAIKALSVDDDDCYRAFIDWLPFETTRGTKTIRELREQGDPIRYVSDVSSFRQAESVASATGLLLVNAGYVHESELLARLPEFFPDTNVELLDADSLSQDFEELTLDEQEQTNRLLREATAALRPFHCVPDVRRFLPAEIAAFFSAGDEARFHRSLDRAQEQADATMAGVLEAIKSRDTVVPSARLCLNFNNPLIAELAQSDSSEVLRRATEVLYVQALLLAHQPLTSREMQALNQGLAGMVKLALKNARPT